MKTENPMDLNSFDLKIDPMTFRETPGLIGISCAEDARSTIFWDSFLNLDKCGAYVKVSRGGNISDNRNALVKIAIENKCPWVFFVDDDQIFADDTLVGLLAREVDIVSGLYICRQPPFAPVAFDQENEMHYVTAMTLKDGLSGMVEVKAVGAGALLVRSNVFETMPRPWWTVGQIVSDSMSDDIDFCRRARACGFKINVDLDEPVGHVFGGVVWAQRVGDEWTTLEVVNNKPVARFPAAK